MSVEGWNFIEKSMREYGFSNDVIETEKVKYIYDSGILQFDTEDKRPTEVSLSDVDEKGMRTVSFKSYGVKSAIPFTRKIIFNDDLLKIISLPAEEQLRVKKLTYSPYRRDRQKLQKMLRNVQIDYSNPSVQAARILVGKEITYTVDNE
jgi:hypothetical protein